MQQFEPAERARVIYETSTASRSYRLCAARRAAWIEKVVDNDGELAKIWSIESYWGCSILDWRTDLARNRVNPKTSIKGESHTISRDSGDGSSIARWHGEDSADDVEVISWRKVKHIFFGLFRWTTTRQRALTDRRTYRSHDQLSAWMNQLWFARPKMQPGVRILVPDEAMLMCQV